MSWMGEKPPQPALESIRASFISSRTIRFIPISTLSSLDQIHNRNEREVIRTLEWNSSLHKTERKTTMPTSHVRASQPMDFRLQCSPRSLSEKHYYLKGSKYVEEWHEGRVGMAQPYSMLFYSLLAAFPFLVCRGESKAIDECFIALSRIVVQQKYLSPKAPSTDTNGTQESRLNSRQNKIKAP